MTSPPYHPSLYQINTRVLMTYLTRRLGKKATLDDIPDGELDRLAGMGFDWLWFLSVWQTGDEGRSISRTHHEWQREFRETLADLTIDDIGGSGFAIQSYAVHSSLGGPPALARLRSRLAERGMKLMLDFVPNHMAPDHPWVEEHPDYFVHGTPELLEREPQNYRSVETSNGTLILAHGRDPYFDGWPDTLQLNYGNPELQDAMRDQLMSIASQCDGVRCDMAMLVMPDVFYRTWHIQAQPFWSKAIESVRSEHPDFLFMAEVYWDMEWEMLQQGFTYAYDKRLYDRLREGHARPVREHLMADLSYQYGLARFLENHDEPRAAATFSPEQHQAAAIITYLTPGLRFFHQGQFEGRRARISPHLVRAPDEPPDEQTMAFYSRLLMTLRKPLVRTDEWQLLECAEAWEGNWTWDNFIGCGWTSPKGSKRVVVVNYSDVHGQCYLQLPFNDLVNTTVLLNDVMGKSAYTRSGTELVERGLYLDLPPWGYHVFDVTIL